MQVYKIDYIESKFLYIIYLLNMSMHVTYFITPRRTLRPSKANDSLYTFSSVLPFLTAVECHRV